MPGYLEIETPSGRDVVALEGERITVGKLDTNEIALGGDGAVSRLHAVFERYPAGWCVRDLGSRNGTYVNGQRIWGERRLLSGDEIRVGGTRIVYRGADPAGVTQADVSLAPPELTRREHEVLVELCRPVMLGQTFTEPASVRDIAERLVVTETAVKQHLTHLYDKFAVYEESEPKRVRLANEAIRRAAVTLSDLRGGERPAEGSG